MNTKQLLMTVALVTAISTIAMAEETPPAAAEGQKHKTAQFEERKAKAQQRLSARAAEMQKKQACVQAADNPDALKSCFPNKGKRGEHGKSGKNEERKSDRK